jgi:hypothetical protein
MFLARCNAVAAQPHGEIRYKVLLTNSLKSRGIVVLILGEAPDATTPRSSRSLSYHQFQLVNVGECPINGGDGWEEDGHPFGSTHFTYPRINLYLTEKDEWIDVRCNEDGSEYWANVPMPWCEGSNRTLINFSDLHQPAPEQPMTAEISGSMKKENLLITLRSPNRAYSYTWDFKNRKWFHLPVAYPRGMVIATQPPPTTTPFTEPTSIGDRMYVSMVGQSAVGVHAHLVTLMVESPSENKKSRKLGFYYFLQQAEDYSDLSFVAVVSAEDAGKVGSGPGDNPAAATVGKLSGSLLTHDAKLTLTTGGRPKEFIFDFDSGKWAGDK